ncbi:MAG: greA [Limisphaerales bacterium]|nr:MAG: greA [Limisphaerales bacterium]KAG0506917.1 MAG: greA [Limisphaerales bacterium]TXT47174.1 MAG: greA [Limisphaerales bacterium]
MRDELEKLAIAGKIGSKHIDPLLTLAQGGYCAHKSWGFGRITTVDTVFCQFTIDFQGKPGHKMDLSFAAESLKSIPADHILAKKAADLHGLRQMAARDHLGVIRLVLNSYGGKATLDQIQKELVPDVITDDWKKWLEVAKREMKKDGHFIVPLKKTEPILYQAQETTVQQRVMDKFKAAKGLKARITEAAELLKNVDDLDNKAAVVGEAIATLNAEITSHQRTQPALALEAVFLRDELRKAAGLTPAEGELTEIALWNQGLKLGQLLDGMPAAKHRRALDSFKEATPTLWYEAVIGTLNNVSAKLAGECAAMLMENGKLDLLRETLARLISQHQASSDLLLWLAKERSDTFADILGPEVFRAMVSAIERDIFNEKKSNKLRDFILADHELLPELISSADIEVVKDLTRSLQMSPSFDDMDRRSLLARIVKVFPIVKELITGEATKQDHTFIVSWESLERRRAEYDDLCKKRIPANSKDIALARSYGDLRENHEYKAAKEMQKVLMRRKSELEVQLNRARGTDFANVRTDVVSIGTKVNVHDVNNQKGVTFKVCGAWDSDPDNGIIAYLSPIGQALLNHPVGDEVEFELQGTKHKFRIDAIEALPPAPKPPEHAEAEVPAPAAS